MKKNDVFFFVISHLVPEIEEDRWIEDRTLFNVALHLAKSYFTGSPQIRNK